MVELAALAQLPEGPCLLRTRNAARQAPCDLLHAACEAAGPAEGTRFLEALPAWAPNPCVPSSTRGAAPGADAPVLVHSALSRDGPFFWLSGGSGWAYPAIVGEKVGGPTPPGRASYTLLGALREVAGPPDAYARHAVGGRVGYSITWSTEDTGGPGRPPVIYWGRLTPGMSVT